VVVLDKAKCETINRQRKFYNKVLSRLCCRKWKELNVLKDTEKYNMISKPETGLQAWT